MQQRVVNNNINCTECERYISMKVLNIIHKYVSWSNHHLLMCAPPLIFVCQVALQRGLEDFYIHTHIFLCQVAFSSVYKQCGVN